MSNRDASAARSASKTHRRPPRHGEEGVARRGNPENFGSTVLWIASAQARKNDELQTRPDLRSEQLQRRRQFAERLVAESKLPN